MHRRRRKKAPLQIAGASLLVGINKLLVALKISRYFEIFGQQRVVGPI